MDHLLCVQIHARLQEKGWDLWRASQSHDHMLSWEKYRDRRKGGTVCFLRYGRILITPTAAMAWLRSRIKSISETSKDCLRMANTGGRDHNAVSYQPGCDLGILNSTQRATMNRSALAHEYIRDYYHWTLKMWIQLPSLLSSTQPIPTRKVFLAPCFSS